MKHLKQFVSFKSIPTRIKKKFDQVIDSILKTWTYNF